MRMARVKPSSLWIVIALVILAIVMVFFVLCNHTVISKGKIEQDARKFHNIDSDWISIQQTTDNISAMIFYPDDMSDHIYSIYLKQPNTFAGYSVRAGGTISEIRQGIVRFYVSECESYIFMSMNAQQICKIVVDDGDHADVTLLEENKPFTIILPSNAGNIFFYDASGNTINFIQRSLPQ